MQGRVIAVDGPAASGKSTVSRAVAARLGDWYVDSGSLYRAVTWWALERGCDTGDAAALEALVASIAMTFELVDGAVRFRLNGQRLDAELREERINRHVSLVAVVPAVRARVVAWLRGMRELGNLVVEGRDIGTAVFPDTPWKFYLDASAEARALRRHAELAGGAASLTVADVGASIERRDRIDSGRATAPLRIADGAEIVDSTALSVDDVVALIVARIPAAK
jgi:CMP/dCMP kinase